MDVKSSKNHLSAARMCSIDPSRIIAAGVGREVVRRCSSSGRLKIACAGMKARCISLWEYKKLEVAQLELTL